MCCVYFNQINLPSISDAVHWRTMRILFVCWLVVLAVWNSNAGSTFPRSLSSGIKMGFVPMSPRIVSPANVAVTLLLRLNPIECSTFLR